VYKPDKIDRAILRYVQDDLPLVRSPYRELSESVGISEDEICVRLQAMLDGGLIRRFGAILRHNVAGYHANAMVVWEVVDGSRESAADVLLHSDAVSHLYSRPDYPGWPCNLFSMVHARDENELEVILYDLRNKLSELIDDYHVLRSVREFKKTSMKYFEEDHDE